MSAGKNILLFYCKSHAEQLMRQLQLDSRQWAVRGLPRHVFRTFVLMLDLFAERSGTKAAVLFKPPGLGANESFLCAPAECGALLAEYYGGDIQSMRREGSPRGPPSGVG
jgi:hypothetical protein